jgi:hypothetical protein
MRNSDSQRQRTRQNPLNLGSFAETRVRYLKGSLGPVNKPVGYRDTNSNSNGGMGGGTYNHWFQLELRVPAWIITTKGPPRPKYINVSVYDLNFNPISGRSIFDADSISEVVDGVIYHPYIDQVMGAQSYLTNNFDPTRLDKGDQRYYPLEVGNYLLCISTTRNEPLDYSVGLIIETADLTPFLLLEDYTRILYEDVDPSSCLLDTGPDYTGNDSHLHSLSEWQFAWAVENQDYVPFPEILIPLATSP